MDKVNNHSLLVEKLIEFKEFFQQEAKEQQKAHPIENYSTHAIILSGISGSGKSTYIKENFPDYTIVSMDEIRAELCGNRRDQSRNKVVAQVAKERFVEALRAKEKVVWDATNTRKQHREQLINIAHKHSALTEIHVLLVRESIIREQNKNREFDVPDEVITKQIAQFQLPDYSETHIVKYIIRG